MREIIYKLRDGRETSNYAEARKSKDFRTIVRDINAEKVNKKNNIGIN